VSGGAPRDAETAGWVGWVGLVLVGLSGILAAVVEVVLVPLYVGSVLVPVAVVISLATNVLLPVLAFRLIPRGLAAATPFVLWLLVAFAFGVVARPEGDVLLPGGSRPLEWTSYGVLLGGALAGTLTVVLLVPSRRRVSAGTGRGSPRPAPPGRR
jgi:hypothetical protein